ncbi:MAG: pyridoxamine 5'-phosphate oxidase family protein [Candidatus Hodarchaeales archaeon]|jgi:general stress protein 26
MNNDEIKQFVIQLMETSEAVYLTTIANNGIPYIRAMLNLRNTKQFPYLSKVFTEHQDDLLVYFSTNTSSEKVEQIKFNPRVALYYCKSEKWHGAMLGGSKIEIIDDYKIKEDLWIKGGEKYYPKGVIDEDYTILRYLPEFIRVWASSKGKHEMRIN